MKRRIEELKSEQLNIDPDVQRDAPPPNVVRKFVRDWKRSMTGVLVVSQRDDGRYYVIDGQTRVLAARQIDPDFMFVCEVHEGLTHEDEIDLFEYHNKNRRTVAAIELLRLRLSRGREPYSRIGIELARRRIKLSRSSSQKASRDVISAAQPIEMLLHYDNGPRLFGRVLDAIIRAFPYEETRWRGTFFGGVVQTYIWADRVHVPIDDARLAKVLQRNLPAHWELKARDVRSNVAGSSVLSALAARLIITQYNKRLSPKNQLPTPWKEAQAYDDAEQFEES